MHTSILTCIARDATLATHVVHTTERLSSTRGARTDLAIAAAACCLCTSSPPFAARCLCCSASRRCSFSFAATATSLVSMAALATQASSSNGDQITSINTIAAKATLQQPSLGTCRKCKGVTNKGGYPKQCNRQYSMIVQYSASTSKS